MQTGQWYQASVHCKLLVCVQFAWSSSCSAVLVGALVTPVFETHVYSQVG